MKKQSQSKIAGSTRRKSGAANEEGRPVRTEATGGVVLPVGRSRQPTARDWLLVVLSGTLLGLWIIFLAILAIFTGRWR